MCFENLPVEFDENGNAHLKEGVKNPYDYQTRTPEEREAKCRVTLKSVLPHFVWRNYPETGKFRRYSCEFEEALVARERCCRSKR